MNEKKMDAASIQKLLAPLFPGLLGVRLEEATEGHVRAALTVRPDLCTVGGILHGGALMALADTLGAVGAFVGLLPGRRTTTIESSTKFIAGARVGTDVSADCRALHLGKTTSVWQTEIRTHDGRLCAVVTQTQLTLDA